jgi:hypothetical protein
MADTRFEVRINERLANELQEIADENGLTKSDIFRRAIALYKIAKKAQQDKGMILIRESNNHERELVGI